jgi:hypothetical protein
VVPTRPTAFGGSFFARSSQSESGKVFVIFSLSILLRKREQQRFVFGDLILCQQTNMIFAEHFDEQLGD